MWKSYHHLSIEIKLKKSFKYTVQFGISKLCFHCVFAAVFDRQYVAAYERLPERDLKLYQRCDKPPSIASLYCRHYFKELEL